MTLPVLRRPARQPRPVLVSVTDHWARTTNPDGTPGDFRRRVVLRTPAGELRPALLPDSHPALLAYLARAAA